MTELERAKREMFKIDRVIDILQGMENRSDKAEKELNAALAEKSRLQEQISSLSK